MVAPPVQVKVKYYPLVAALDNRLRHAPCLPILDGPAEPADDERTENLKE
jgi:hypothetical protein